MKKHYFFISAIIIFGVLSLKGQAVSFTTPQTLKSFLPAIEGLRLGLKDLATWTLIEKQKFPMAMRTYYKNNQKIIIKIVDAHYEPTAYRDYYFYVDLGKNRGGKNDVFSAIISGGEKVYIHQKVKQRLFSGVALVGNRYIVTVNVSPAKDVSLLASVMDQINFTRLAETNNPVKYRKMDFRIKSEPRERMMEQ